MFVLELRLQDIGGLERIMVTRFTKISNLSVFNNFKGFIRKPDKLPFLCIFNGKVPKWEDLRLAPN